VETNGTIRPSGFPIEGIHFNVSPKLSNSFQPFEKPFLFCWRLLLGD